jgi:hypothetical protein
MDAASGNHIAAVAPDVDSLAGMANSVGNAGAGIPALMRCTVPVPMPNAPFPFVATPQHREQKIGLLIL